MAYDPKTTYETIPYSMDFAALLGVATISSAVVSLEMVNASATNDTAGMLSGSPSISTTKVIQSIQAGTAGQAYRVRFQIVDSASNKWESDEVLPVVSVVMGRVS